MHDVPVDTDWLRSTGLPPAPGLLLLATPILDEPPFHRTVVYLLEHAHDSGSLGVVINRPTSDAVEKALPPWRDVISHPAVLFEGGPVQQDGALCLGATEEDAQSAGVRPLHDGVASIDLDGDPHDVIGVASALRVFVGYAGWSPGQLDDELAQGAWWVVPGSRADVFSERPESLWASVLRRQPPPLAFASTYPDDPARN